MVRLYFRIGVTINATMWTSLRVATDVLRLRTEAGGPLAVVPAPRAGSRRGWSDSRRAPSMQADGRIPGIPARTGCEQAWRMRPRAAEIAASSRARERCSASDGTQKAKPRAEALRAAFPYHWAKLTRMSLIPAAAAAPATSGKRSRLERISPRSSQNSRGSNRTETRRGSPAKATSAGSWASAAR